jgi:hypothetical protein
LLYDQKITGNPVPSPYSLYSGFNAFGYNVFRKSWIDKPESFIHYHHFS